MATNPWAEWGDEAGARRAFEESQKDGRAASAGFPNYDHWRRSHLAKFEGRASPDSPVGSATAAGQAALHQPGGAYHMTEAQKNGLQWPVQSQGAGGGDPITRAYRDLLGRDPDPGGAAYWRKEYDAWVRQYGPERAGQMLTERFKQGEEYKKRQASGGMTPGSVKPTDVPGSGGGQLPANPPGGVVVPPPPPPPPPAGSLPPGGVAANPYTAPQNPDLFADFDLAGYLDGIMGGSAPTPGAAPERTGPTMGAVQAGPQYETAEGAFQGEELSPDLVEYARRLMENPNVYDEGFVADSLGVINADIDRQRADAMRGLDERMAARGTIAGSPDLLEGYDIATRLAEVEAARKNDLAKFIGQAELQGRGLGLNAGLGVGEFGRGLGSDRRSEGQFSWQADRTTGRDAEEDARFRYSAGEDRYRFDAQNQLQRDALALDAYRTDLNAGMQAAQMRLQELGMRADEAFRYSQLATDTEFRNRALQLQSEGMRLDEAFRRAELDLRGELGRGELGIREKEAAAQIAAMDFNKLMGIGNLIIAAKQANIPAKDIEGIVAAIMGGDLSEEEVQDLTESLTPKPEEEQPDELPTEWPDEQDWWNPFDWGGGDDPWSTWF